MPRSFAFPLQGMEQGDMANVFVPMAFTREELADEGDNFNYSVLARLKPGISLQGRRRCDRLSFPTLRSSATGSSSAPWLCAQHQDGWQGQNTVAPTAGSRGPCLAHRVRQCRQPPPDPCSAPAKGNCRPEGAGRGPDAPASPVGGGKSAVGSGGSGVGNPSCLRNSARDGRLDAKIESSPGTEPLQKFAS